MLYTLRIRLLPDKAQYRKLLKTMEKYNEACNELGRVVFEGEVYSKIRLHKLCYYRIREEFGLPSQLTITAFRNVIENAKKNKKELTKFNRYDIVVYDRRLYSYGRLETINLSTTEGKVKVPMMVKEYIKGTLMDNRIRGQGDLILEDGEWWFYAVEDIGNLESMEKNINKNMNTQEKEKDNGM